LPSTAADHSGCSAAFHAGYTSAMGSRANYAIIEDGRCELFYSHWGAQHIDRDFFFGPRVATGLVRSSTPSTISDMLDDVWCEGSALIDFDRQLMQCWGGDDICRVPRLRQLWLQLAEISWAGWEVRWAEHGILDLADALEVPRERVRCDEMGHIVEEIPFNEVLLYRDVPAYIGTFTTLLRPDDTSSDLFAGAPPDSFLRAGPCLLDLLDRCWRVEVSSDEKTWNQYCLFLDVPRHTLHIDFGRLTVHLGWNQVVEHQWPGWKVHQHHGGMAEHLRLTGRDPTPFFRPLREHLPAIAHIILGSDMDPQMLLKVFENTREEGEHFTHLNPHFLTPHRLEMSKEERMERFLAVVSEWKRRHPEQDSV
jgi:hypothetical protein